MSWYSYSYSPTPLAAMLNSNSETIDVEIWAREQLPQWGEEEGDRTERDDDECRAIWARPWRVRLFRQPGPGSTC
jgi:hypothetical protein